MISTVAKKLASTAALTVALTGTFAAGSQAWADTIAPAPQPTQPAGPSDIAPAPQPTKPAGPSDIAPAPQPTKPAGPGDIAPAPQPTKPAGPGDIAPAPQPTDPGHGPDDKVSDGDGGGGAQPTGPDDLANPTHGCQTTHGCPDDSDSDSDTDSDAGSDGDLGGTEEAQSVVSDGSPLPFTGDHTQLAAELGGALLLAGLLAMVLARHRRTT